MPISNLEEYDKVLNVSWFTPDKPREDLMCVPHAKLQELFLTMILDSHLCCHFHKCIRSAASISATFSIDFISSRMITSSSLTLLTRR